MESSSCCNCGKTFIAKGKSRGRKSLQSTAVINRVNRTLQDLIEEELDVILTPHQKRQRFLCASCSWAVISMAKSSVAKKEALTKIREHGETSYLAKKIRSPVPTPRKIKKMRVTSPRKEPECQTVPTPPKKRKQLTLPEMEVNKALNCIKQRKYSRGLSLLIKARKGFRKAILTYTHNTVRAEVRSLCRDKPSSFKGGKTLGEISGFDWEKQFTELQTKCPTLSSVLIGALTSERSMPYFGLASKPSLSAKPVIGTIASIITFERKPKTLNYFQQLNSVQMWLAGCQREMFSRLNHLGLCIEIKGTRSYLDHIRTSYDAEVLKWKTNISDYLLGLQSDSSASAAYTIPYADSEATLSIDSFPSSTASSPQRQHNSPIRRGNFQAHMQDSPQLHSDEDMVLSSTKSTSDVEENMSHSDKSLPKGRYGFSLCFDNVNQRTTVRHQTRDNKNKMFNMVQGYAALDRVPTLHLNDVPPLPESIKTIPLENYLPSEMDEVDLRFEFTTIINRIMCEYIPIFKPLATAINWHIQHRYSQISASKSHLVPIGVLDKDESRVSDTIDILEEYHKYVPLKPNGQPFPLVLHADGLSVERGNNAQNARINGNTAWTQLQGLQMNIQEWHKRCLLLQDIFDEMYKGSSGREIGTLFQLKNYFNHRNVTSNVKQSFNHDEEFLEFTTNGYVVLAAMHVMNLQDLDEIPKSFPNTEDKQMHFLHNVSGKIVDMMFLSTQPYVKHILQDRGHDLEPDSEFCVCRTEHQDLEMIYCANKDCMFGGWFHLDCLGLEEEPDGDWWCSPECRNYQPGKKKKTTVADNLTDHKKSYALKVMWHGLNQRVRRDALRENDRNRIIMHWKFDLLNFFEHNHPKYFHVCHQLLSAINGAVSPRLQHSLKWNRTVNPNGGPGKNLEMDLQMEFFNKEYKESVKDAAGQLTEATIARHSQMVGVGKVISSVYEKQVASVQRSAVQTTDTHCRENDIVEFVSMMRGENIFKANPGRHFKTFPDVTHVLFRKISASAFKKRLIRLRKELADHREITIQMQRN